MLNWEKGEIAAEIDSDLLDNKLIKYGHIRFHSRPAWQWIVFDSFKIDLRLMFYWPYSTGKYIVDIAIILSTLHRLSLHYGKFKLCES